MDKATEQLYREREKRFLDAVQLKVPDRVPTSIHLSYLPARICGITFGMPATTFRNGKKPISKQPYGCSGPVRVFPE